MFDLEKYRLPVLSKVEAAIQHIQTERLTQTDAEQSSQPRSTGDPQSERPSKLFSQMVIDCLALKVQELDDSPQSVQKDKSITKREIRIRINTSKDRIHYFLKQYEEENQLFMEHYRDDRREEEFKPLRG
jgi:hypothetical protein